jgi:hypothetical protein
MTDDLVPTPVRRIPWQVLTLLGTVAAVLGMVEIAFTWLPQQLGTAEWEFGTTSAFFDNFPITGLGLVMLVASGVAAGSRWRVRLVALVCILMAVFMWLAAALYATVLPIMLTGISDPQMVLTLEKGAVKTGAQALLYPFALLWLAGSGWRATYRRRAG